MMNTFVLQMEELEEEKQTLDQQGTKKMSVCMCMCVCIYVYLYTCV